jgi:hypothetical protein
MNKMGTPVTALAHRSIHMARERKIKALSWSLAAILLGMLSTSAVAIEFASEDGEWSGNFDTTISYGIAMRTGDADDDNLGKAVFNPIFR